MAETTGINWCDSTFNPWWGCTEIAPACDNCYAAALDKRTGGDHWGNNERRRTSIHNWNEPRRWEKNWMSFFGNNGRKRRVFCASMADVFDNQVPKEWRADLWQLIRECQNLDWLLLTKRPQNIEKMLPDFWDEIKGSIWLGTTIEDQKHADQNLPFLLKHDSAYRFVSCEPLLGPIDLSNTWPDHTATLNPFTGKARHLLGMSGQLNKLDWVISGGESGPNARPSHPDWFRSLRDQCAAAGAAYLHKQNGEWIWHGDIGEDDPAFMRAQIQYLGGDLSRAHFFPDGQNMARVGTKNSGRTLDGVTHDAFPERAL